ncbi:hypothetical protein GF324_12550, partial [bacterium]|nr:hypothetical protein [bacterium]
MRKSLIAFILILSGMNAAGPSYANRLQEEILCSYGPLVTNVVPFSEDGRFLGKLLKICFDSSQTDRYVEIISTKHDYVFDRFNVRSCPGIGSLNGYELVYSNLTRHPDSSWHMVFSIRGEKEKHSALLNLQNGEMTVVETYQKPDSISNPVDWDAGPSRGKFFQTKEGGPVYYYLQYYTGVCKLPRELTIYNTADWSEPLYHQKTSAPFYVSDFHDVNGDGDLDMLLASSSPSNNAHGPFSDRHVWFTTLDLEQGMLWESRMPAGGGTGSIWHETGKDYLCALYYVFAFHGSDGEFSYFYHFETETGKLLSRTRFEGRLERLRNNPKNEFSYYMMDLQNDSLVIFDNSIEPVLSLGSIDDISYLVGIFHLGQNKHDYIKYMTSEQQYKMIKPDGTEVWRGDLQLLPYSQLKGLHDNEGVPLLLARDAEGQFHLVRFAKRPFLAWLISTHYRSLAVSFALLLGVPALYFGNRHLKDRLRMERQRREEMLLRDKNDELAEKNREIERIHTELQTAYATLSRQSDAVLSTFNAVQDALVKVNRNLDVLLANNCFYDLFDVEDQCKDTCNLADLVPEIKDILHLTARQTLEGGLPVRSFQIAVTINRKKHVLLLDSTE